MDFAFHPSLKRAQIQSLRTLGFVERRENVILLGQPGVGNPHFAISLAIAAAGRGRRVDYGTLADLITSLEEAAHVGWLQQRLKTLVFPSLVVVDEIGYLPVSRAGAPRLSRPSPAQHNNEAPANTLAGASHVAARGDVLDTSRAELRDSARPSGAGHATAATVPNAWVAYDLVMAPAVEA